MKNLQIVHNPTAGSALHNRQDLLDLFKGSAEVIHYVSTEEEGWEDFANHQADALFIAGGDGTVRKTAQLLLKEEREGNPPPPLGLIPLGTANNISDTLGIPSDNKLHLDPEGGFRFFDCGMLKGLKDEHFFMESVGFGIFPKLISRTQKEEIETEDPSEEIRRVLNALVEVTEKFKAKKARLKVDGISIKGSFLLVELMNIKSLGPNLKLAPQADPGDGYFDLVLIPEKKRPQLLSYLEKLKEGREEGMDLQEFITALRVKKLKMQWEGGKLHVDDSLVDDYSGKGFKVKIAPRTFRFLK